MTEPTCPAPLDSLPFHIREQSTAAIVKFLNYVETFEEATQQKKKLDAIQDDSKQDETTQKKQNTTMGYET
jgi:hypothetical protein